MGIIIVIVILLFAIGFIKAMINEKNKPTMDDNGNIRCKECGCTSFVAEQDHKGNTVTRCVMCGHSWRI